MFRLWLCHRHRVELLESRQSLHLGCRSMVVGVCLVVMGGPQSADRNGLQAAIRLLMMVKVVFIFVTNINFLAFFRAGICKSKKYTIFCAYLTIRATADIAWFRITAIMTVSRIFSCLRTAEGWKYEFLVMLKINSSKFSLYDLFWGMLLNKNALERFEFSNQFV